MPVDADPRAPGVWHLNGGALSYEGQELEAAANLVNCYRWITDCFKPYLHGDGTEVGAGIGTYSEYLRPHFSSMDIVEPSPKQHPQLLEKFAGDSGMRIFAETIDQYFARTGSHARDTICLVNVLEHIDDDEDALRTLTKILRTDGHICIFVPAMPFLYSKFDRVLDHHRRYTLPELERKFEAAGLEVVQSKYMDVLGITAWGLVNTVIGSTTLHPLLTKIYDTVFIPLTRAIESVIRMPFGKSALIIGRKRV